MANKIRGFVALTGGTLGCLDALAELTAQVEAQRQAAYHVESDPIFFRAQRGEATLQDWEAKVDEIRARYPYPAGE